MLRQYELVEQIKAYDPDADEDLLNRAYVFSMMAHGNQLRASGDPYFSHPIEVAGILTDLKLDTETIVTGIFSMIMSRNCLLRSRSSSIRTRSEISRTAVQKSSSGPAWIRLRLIEAAKSDPSLLQPSSRVDAVPICRCFGV